MAADWGVLVTERQRHRLALDQLACHGIEYFQPWRELVRVTRGFYHRQRVPFFGPYLFVAICSAWRTLPGLRGVAGLLLDSDRLEPLTVDPKQLQAVRNRCDRNGVVRDLEPPRAGLRYGDGVFVENGPLAFLHGTYDGQVGRHKEAALFVMFGRERRVMFPVGELKPLGN